VAVAGTGPYEPKWESLKRHRVPEWFRDAKFGIYTHWGPVTLGSEEGPGGAQWYGRNMYVRKSPCFEFHRKRFGDQRKVGYKDIIPLFKAEKFDAEAWARLFAEAGAKFAGPVAIHHDNFAMWDSALTRWDAKDMGPHRDIVGELAKAIRARGMRFLVAFHHGFTWRYFEPAMEFDGRAPGAEDLYWPHKPGEPPPRAFQERWLAMVDEVVRKYEPDLAWFDFGLGSVIMPEYQQRMFADYYNWAATHGREVAVAHKHRNVHRWTGVLDFERGREDRLTPYPWLTDTAIGPWFHQKSAGFKTVDQIVDVLVDIVSKNGCMLLNVGPTAEGEIPEVGKKLLRGIGKWLRVNGEAIYGTRPWLIYGEGPTRSGGGGFSERRDKPFTPRDIRFTRSKDGKTLYAIALAWPEGPLTLEAVAVKGVGPGARVELLGLSGKLPYRINELGQLVIEVPKLPPEKRPCGCAYAFRTTGFDLRLGPGAAFHLPGARSIEPTKVTIEGTKARLQTKGGRPNIGAWDDPKERLHWLARVEKPGRWLVRLEVSAGVGPSALKLSVEGHSSKATVPKTAGWFNTKWLCFAPVAFEKPGVYHFTLEAGDPARWRPVNLWKIELGPLPEE